MALWAVKDHHTTSWVSDIARHWVNRHAARPLDGVANDLFEVHLRVAGRCHIQARPAIACLPSGLDISKVAVEAPITQLISAKGGAERGNKSRQRAWHRSYQQQRAATLRICPGHGGHFKLPLNFSEGREFASVYRARPPLPLSLTWLSAKTPLLFLFPPVFPDPTLVMSDGALPPASFPPPSRAIPQPKIPRNENHTRRSANRCGWDDKKARPRTWELVAVPIQ